jgi:branched-subunit amino acid permease
MLVVIPVCHVILIEKVNGKCYKLFKVRSVIFNIIFKVSISVEAGAVGAAARAASRCDSDSAQHFIVKRDIK